MSPTAITIPSKQARIRKLLTFALAVAITGCAEGPAMMKHHVSGAEATIPDLRGHVVLLNFWATWCRPCLLEIPVLAQVAADFGPDVLFVAVYHADEGSERGAVTEWLLHKPGYVADQLVWGTPALHDAYPHPALPTTYVLGRDGQLIIKFEGAILGKREAELRDVIQRALAAPTPTAQ